MIRLGLIMICVVSIATLSAEILGVGLLWYRNQLTSETIKDIRLILTGQDQNTFVADEEAENVQPSAAAACCISSSVGPAWTTFPSATGSACRST